MIKKIFFSSFLFFSIILTAYIIYRSEIHWNGESRAYYLKYYYISAFFLTLSFFSFFLSEKIKLYIMIVLISVISTLYLYEGYIIIKNPVTNDAKPFSMAYKDSLQSNPNLSLPVFPFYHLNDKNIDYFPLTGQSYADLIYCNENGYYNKFTSDRYGFNNPDQVWDTTAVKYLIVGDSFAYGNCVNRPDDISSVLRKLSQKNVINLGQSGIGPLIKFAILKEFFPENVENVIWLYYEGNDLGDLKFELKNDILKKYIIQQDFSQELKKNQNKTDAIVKKLRLELNKSLNKRKIFKSIKNFIKLQKVRNNFFPLIMSVPNNNFRKIIKKAKDLSNSRNAKFIFIYLPEFARYQKNYRNDQYEVVKNIIMDLDIQFIDINDSVFRKLNNPNDLFPLLGKGHYNEAGYYKTSESIFKNVN